MSKDFEDIFNRLLEIQGVEEHLNSEEVKEWKKKMSLKVSDETFNKQD